MNGWTDKALLAEAGRLIDQINTATDPATIKQLDGCFKAVQEVLIKKAPRQWPTKPGSSPKAILRD